MITSVIFLICWIGISLYQTISNKDAEYSLIIVNIWMAAVIILCVIKGYIK